MDRRRPTLRSQHAAELPELPPGGDVTPSQRSPYEHAPSSHARAPYGERTDSWSAGPLRRGSSFDSRQEPSHRSPCARPGPRRASFQDWDGDRGSGRGTPRQHRRCSASAHEPAEESRRAECTQLVVAVRLRPPAVEVGGFSPVCQDSALWHGADMKWMWDGDTVTKAVGENQGHEFRYSHVFGPETATEALYRKTARATVMQALDGVNGCIFAYGQTNSGKTYTVVGTVDSPGIVPLACVDAFNHVRQRSDVTTFLRVSYLEIYNEVPRDLLRMDSGQPVQICEDETGEFVAQGLTEEPVSCLEEVLRLVARGNRRRAVGTNNVHERASRSHAIFQLVIETQDAASHTVRVSRLNMVDLAGSETNYQTVGVTPKDVLDKIKDQTTIAARAAAATPRALAEQESAVRKNREGSNIRKSLNALVRVVQVLSSGRDGYVPYRDSKLTRLLRNALGGNSHTCCICTVNPDEDKETMSTLRFAAEAQRVRNRPRAVAVASDRAMIGRLESDLASLRKNIFLQQAAKDEELRALKQAHGANELELKGAIGVREAEVQSLQKRLAGLEKYLLTSKKTEKSSTSLSAYYDVADGHGGGMTEDMIAARGAEEPSPKVKPRKRCSLPDELFRCDASKSLFGIADAAKSPTGLDARASSLRDSQPSFHRELLGLKHRADWVRYREQETKLQELEERVCDAEESKDIAGREAEALREALSRTATARDLAQERLSAAEAHAAAAEAAAGVAKADAAVAEELEDVRLKLLAAEQQLAEERRKADAAAAESVGRQQECAAAKDRELADVRRALQDAQKKKQGDCGCTVQ